MKKSFFEEIELFDYELNDNKVIFLGKSQNWNCKLELSILELTRLLRLDKDVVKNAEKKFKDFEKYEKQCTQTKNFLEDFQNFEFRAITLRIEDIVYDRELWKDHLILVFEHTFYGWKNEGIYLILPADLNLPNNLKLKLMKKSAVLYG